MSTILDHNSAIRLAAFERLRWLEAIHGEILPLAAIAKGFMFEGQRVPFLFSGRGIFKPTVLTDAPLSITTVPPSLKKPAPYDDESGDDGLWRYRYQGTNPLAPDNVGLRRAMAGQIPLIYFNGAELIPGQYRAIWPVFVENDDPSRLTFTIRAEDQDRAFGDRPPLGDSAAEGRREYITTEIQRRVHQDGFRVRVLGAYRNRCSVCNLKHSKLLDAAHILPDRHPKGVPAVWNGLALCKLHHAAFDSLIMGIRPDLKIDIREDVLKEVDGPMLVHGLQGFNGRSIAVPRPPEHRPKSEFLEERYAQFRTGS